MRWFAQIAFHVKSLFAKRKLDEQLSEEIRAHVEMATEANVAKGMPPEEARYAALREFGNPVQVQEKAQDERGWVWLEQWARDFRFSVRSLRRSAGFSAAVVITLALCTGANTAILTVLHGLVLKPLPFHDAGQIVEVYNMRPKTGQMKLQLGLGQYLDYKANADLFESFSLWTGWMFNIGEEGGTARYVGMRITPDYFSVLGVQPLMGRFFTEEECLPGRDGVIVLTQTFWEKQFRGDPDILGKEVWLTGRPFTVVGVLPRSFEKVSVAPVLMKPLERWPDHTKPPWRLASLGSMYARIKPGVDHGAALAQLQALEERNRDTMADPALRDYLYNGGHRMGLRQLRAEQMAPVKTSLLLLQGTALFVLLLGCVNVTSLMLARANTRQAEFAVRQALGAGRGALARQLFAEAALLAVTGGALGLGLAGASLRVINTYMDKIVFGIPPVRLDGGMLGLTLLVALLVTLLIGWLPVLRVWRAVSLQSAIQSGTRGSSRNGGIRAMSGVLVTAQVALALILAVGAGLLMRSFAKVMAINPGFDAAKVIYARVAYDSSHADLAKLQGLQNRILEKMREIPGVESVAYSDRLPGFAEDRPVTLRILGMASGQNSTYPTAVLFGASPEYFSTMGIRLLEGRNFTAADQLPGARDVFIVDRKFAERYFPGRSAVGQRFVFKDQESEEASVIVGVVEVARVSGLEGRNVEPYFYGAMGISQHGLSIELRTERSFEDMLPLIRAQLSAVDPTLPIYGAQSMQMRLDDAAANRRGVMWLLGAFAGTALILSAVGTYGMQAYDVTQRTKEIGIRGALGATREQIVALIARQGLWRAGAGLLIGLAVSLWLSAYVKGLLYEVESRDPQIFASVAVLLFGVVLLACWLPARRAAKVDPMIALRAE